MKIIADNKIPFLHGVLEPFADIEYIPGCDIDNKSVRDADALIIRTRTKCNEKLLKGTKVKFIATATIGYDHIDTEYCNKNNVYWTNAPGCNSSSVQQYIASALISFALKKGIDLSKRTLGVIGVGNVGSKIVKLAEILGINVYLCDPPRMRSEGPCQFISLEGILRECDIITFHVPLNLIGEDATYHMADEYFFKKVNKGTIIINSSRGEVVETYSLKKWIKSGHLGGLILDVWENEPNIDKELLDLVDFATPHIAGYSTDGKANGTAMSVQALSKFFDLGIDEWTPEDIPPPSDSIISIDNRGKKDNDILYGGILNTYKISEDDARLRSSVATFEKQRGDYPLRREFKAYKIKLTEKNDDLEKRIKRVGFGII